MPSGHDEVTSDIPWLIKCIRMACTSDHTRVMQRGVASRDEYFFAVSSRVAALENFRELLCF